MQVQQIEKEKKDLAQKLSGVSKRIDHLERAFRREEIPLLKQDYERQQARDKEAHENAQASRAESARRQYTEDLAIKTSLGRIMPDFAHFRQTLEAESRIAYEERKREMQAELERAKDARRKKVAAQIQYEAEEDARREAERAEELEHQAGKCTIAPTYSGI